MTCDGSPPPSGPRQQDRVGQPQHAEADPQHLPPGWLAVSPEPGADPGERAARSVRALCAGTVRLPAHTHPRHRQYREDEQGDDALVEQRGPEGGDHRGVVGVQAVVHPGHIRTSAAWPEKAVVRPRCGTHRPRAALRRPGAPAVRPGRVRRDGRPGRQRRAEPDIYDLSQFTPEIGPFLPSA
jgi:hypothetical protein